MDKLYIHGLKCKCIIGVYAWEKKIPQRLVFDIDLAMDNHKAAANDNLNDALDYQAISSAVVEFAQANPFELIETLAERVAALLLSEFGTQWVRIKLDKGGILKDVSNVGVVIERGTRS